MTFSARLPAGLEVRLTEIAKAHSLPRIDLIVRILQEWVAEYERAHKPV